jgi:squalene-hopene/tetraprenyl-beta-curcumene cyclase
LNLQLLLRGRYTPLPIRAITAGKDCTVNYTYSRTASEPISERDAAWLEELAGAVERGRVALLARQESATDDTALSLIGLVDAGQSSNSPECERVARRLLKPARQLNVSESAAVLTALARSRHAIRAAYGEVVHESLNLLVESQNRDGGWSAFDRKVKRQPSCPSITACVLEAIGHFGFCVRQRLVGVAVKFLLAHQEDSGAWRDWQVLGGLQAVGFDMHSLVVRRAVRWLKESQNEDGGWGQRRERENESTATQTAYAMLGLIAADEAESAEVRAGAEFLVGTQRAAGGWGKEAFDWMSPLRSVSFPLMALGRYAVAAGATISAGPTHVLSEIRTEVRRDAISA